MKLRLSVAGLGKLGVPMLAVFAHKGFDIVGVDLDPAFVAAFDAGRSPVSEPGVQDLSTRTGPFSARQPICAMPC